MCIPVSILACDACDRRLVLCAGAFSNLHGQGFGHFCATCRDLYGEEEE